jgi:hypothetical protein
MIRPAEVNTTQPDLIPCVIILDTPKNPETYEQVLNEYASHGFVVLICTGRRCSQVSDIFSCVQVTDLLSIHAYILSQFRWIKKQGIFLLGASYASGIVLRCLATQDQPYAGGILLSPIPFISSIVSQEEQTTVAVASHASTNMLLSEMGLSTVAAHQFSSHSTPNDLRAQRLLSIDREDRARYDLSAIDVPVYIHANIQDSLVNLADIVALFDTTKEKQPKSCIRYVQGVRTSTAYDDVIQWCRAILHHGSIQTYRTEMVNTRAAHHTYTTLQPTDGKTNYTLRDPKRVELYSYLPGFLADTFLDSLLQYIASAYIPIRPLVSLQCTIMWNLVFKRSLDIAGFPVVTFLVDTITPDCGIGLTLFVYDGYGSGRRLSTKYLMPKNTHDKKQPITVRMSMVASRIRCGQELVLVVSNYDNRFTYTGRTRSMITFSDIVLPYLFEH